MARRVGQHAPHKFNSALTWDGRDYLSNLKTGLSVPEEPESAADAPVIDKGWLSAERETMSGLVQNVLRRPRTLPAESRPSMRIRTSCSLPHRASDVRDWTNEEIVRPMAEGAKRSKGSNKSFVTGTAPPHQGQNGFGT